MPFKHDFVADNGSAGFKNKDIPILGCRFHPGMRDIWPGAIFDATQTAWIAHFYRFRRFELVLSCTLGLNLLSKIPSCRESRSGIFD
jgi:hypothetical protein